MGGFFDIAQQRQLAHVESLLPRALWGIDARPGDDDDARQEARIAGWRDYRGQASRGGSISEKILIANMRRAAMRFVLSRQREGQHEHRVA